MTQKNEFRTVEFFRKVRDEQAALLVGKPRDEILAFFAAFNQDSPECLFRCRPSARADGSGKNVPDGADAPSG